MYLTVLYCCENRPNFSLCHSFAGLSAESDPSVLCVLYLSLCCYHGRRGCAAETQLQTTCWCQLLGHLWTSEWSKLVKIGNGVEKTTTWWIEHYIALTVLLFVSAAHSYFVWSHALPPHHKVFDFADGEQHLGFPSYTLHSFTLQPLLANGKQKVKQHEVTVGAVLYLSTKTKWSFQLAYDAASEVVLFKGNDFAFLYIVRKYEDWDRESKSDMLTFLCPRFQVWSCWGPFPV